MFISSMHQSLVFLCLLAAIFFHHSRGDVGTAARYGPPFLPTACNGNDQSQFPAGNLFAAAGEGIWDNGASCGRQYKLRCISAAVSGTCINNTIQIKIVDRAQSLVSTPSLKGTTIVLSNTAFAAIANPSATVVNVEYVQ
ncbi:hypothetical protein AB3S75_018875 [Citrus x aurantiifolia]